MTTSSGTTPHQPSAKPSDEADQKQLAMAREEGAEYLAALDYMATRVADAGGKARAGDYIVAFAQERAEGMYHLDDGALKWIEAEPGMNCHVEIAVLDAADHRFIPYLEIECTLTREGREAVRFSPEFLWHPGLYHYGKDVKLPGDGSYDLNVKIAAPAFPRHDKVNGKRYGDAVDVTFRAVAIETGRE